MSYSIPASTGLISVTVNIPDGFYTISDLNTIISKHFVFLYFNNRVSNLGNNPSVQNIRLRSKSKKKLGLRKINAIFSSTQSKEEFCTHFYGIPWNGKEAELAPRCDE